MGILDRSAQASINDQDSKSNSKDRSSNQGRLYSEGLFRQIKPIVKKEVMRIAEENERLIFNIINMKSTLNKKKIDNEWWDRVRGYKKNLRRDKY